MWEKIDDVSEHLITRGFVENYTTWFHHGEGGGHREEEVAYEHEVGSGEESGGYEFSHAYGTPHMSEEATQAEEEDVLMAGGELDEMLRHVEPQVLAASAKGL